MIFMIVKAQTTSPQTFRKFPSRHIDIEGKLMEKKHTKTHYASLYVVDIVNGEKPQMQPSQNVK